MGMLFLLASDKHRLWELKRDLHFVAGSIFEEQIRLAPEELTFVSKL